MNSKISNVMNMNERDLEKLSKAERCYQDAIEAKEIKGFARHEDLLDNDPFKDEVSQPVPQPIALPQSLQDSSQNL